ncbi:MAG: hypothetical protein ABJP34_13610 [Erythrobacter sp.]
MTKRPFFAYLAAPLAVITPLHSVSAEDQAALEFGDDTGEFASDGECDDVRYTGDGMAEILLTDSIGKDATDCKAAFKAGTISVSAMHAIPANDEAIDFGDDSSDFAKDGECDDVRFVGAGSNKMIFIAEDIGHDASDCKAAFAAGKVKWQGSSATPELGLTTQDLLELMSETPITT